jgi:Domain of unknown function (DUF6471)
LVTRKVRTGGAGWPPDPSLDANAETDWEDEVRGLIKSTMKRQRLTYADLAQKLGQIGIEENAANLRNKVISALRSFCNVSPRWSAYLSELAPNGTLHPNGRKRMSRERMLGVNRNHPLYGIWGIE